MGQKSVLSYELAKTYVRHWSGLKNFPFHPEGELALVECLMNFCVSVDHARDVRSRFKEACPTPGELEDCCTGLRPRYQAPEPSLKEKWIAEGATYDPAWTKSLIGKLSKRGNEIGDIRIQAIKDMLYYTEGPGRNEVHDTVFWSNARFNDLKNHAELVAAIRQGQEMRAEDVGQQVKDSHDRRAREWKAILAEARKAKPERRSLPTWKLAASLTDREVARITKQLGFELTPWDKQNLEE